jgi:hypothetical protein
MPDTQIPPSPDKPLLRIAPRTRRSLGSRVGRAFRNSTREAFSREQLIASLKSLAWVAPMTVLIWVYAERENAEKQPVSFRVVARNNDPSRLVELQAQAADGHYSSNFVVRAELYGPKAKLEGVRQTLEGGGALEIDIPDLPTGHTPVSASSLLVNEPTLVQQGLSISNIVPGQMEVVIDKIEHRHVRVSVRPTVTNLDGSPLFTPATVEVTGPKSVLDAAGAKLVAYADLPVLTEPGDAQLKNLSVSVPINDPHVTISPAIVSAEVTVKRSDVDGVIKGMIVWAAYPPQAAIWDKYKPDYEPTLPDITVSGPADLIKDINDPTKPNKPKATLELSTNDLTAGPSIVGTQHMAKVKYDLGDPRLKLGTDAPKEWPYKIVVRMPSGDP